ncbi:hypothetical protein O3M35_010059 [Rhynocoris fuscipes]|uniref:Uncharacterized protein n=1 Tax=Rhynocoris fuscipes TaxID=488301 RepID=A0AAW1D5A2_9HEMI
MFSEKMTAYEFVVILMLALALCSNGAKRKPATNYFSICDEKDPKLLNDCIKSTMMEIKPIIAKGIPELGVQPAEPMIIERIEMSDGQNNFRFKQILTDLKVYGLTNYEVIEFSADFKNLTFHTVLLQKQINFDGNYEMDGQILVIPVKGHGQVIYNFTDITVTFDSTMEIYNENGVDYIKIKKSKMDLNPKKGHSYFTNLFNGDKRLGDATNKFLNNNWRDAFEAVRTLPEEAFAEVLTAYANNVYTKFPLKELFPSYEYLL